jgi:prepilin-type N-terminal cleavage/methylation domain-containing protein
MMLKRMSSQRGFTLVELLVVLAILAILLAIVSQNLTGFLGRGKRSSFDIDRRDIQSAVDAYYTAGSTKNEWPTLGAGGSRLGTGVGDASRANSYYINIGDLVSERYLEPAPESTDGFYNNGGLNGSYGWYIDANGVVQAGNTNNDVGYNGNYP